MSILIENEQNIHISWVSASSIDLFKKGIFGRLVALRLEIYADLPLSTISAGQKKVNVGEFNLKLSKEIATAISFKLSRQRGS